MIGTLLNGRYRLDSELGQGGMGIVYRGHDLLLGRDVAIKVLDKNRSASMGTEGRAHLLREAQAAAQLNHPNIVGIFDAGEAEVADLKNKLPFIVMELLPGESLFQKKPETIREILHIALQVTAALDHAHTHGIIHRDLKPENIILLPYGRVKLTDFGLARWSNTRLTTEGLIAGTVLYLAPEVALQQDIDGRADLYSFGVILYELAAGRLPFQADDPLAVISQHLYAPLVPPRAHKPEIPTELNDLIVKLLNKRPEDRPATAMDVHRILTSMGVSGHMEMGRSEPDQEPPVLDRLVRGRMIGRDGELADLTSAWQQAVSGAGQVMLVSGEPGIGKTRLVRELTAHAMVSGGKLLTGNCYAEGGIPYAPFPQIIREYLSSNPASFNLPEFVLADLIKIAPEIETLFPQIRKGGVLELQSEQQRIFESVLTWLTNIAGQSPVLLFVDDVHWADSGALFLLLYLARRTQQMRILIVLTYREVELNEASPIQNVLSDLYRERLATRTKLTRLDREQTREMLKTILSPIGEIQDTLVESIYRETEGNPFYIEEVTKALIEEGKLCYREVCWTSADNQEIEIPQSVRLTVQSRLSRLPAQAQEVLRMAAILGREFDFETLQRASDLDEEQLIEALESAQQAQIIEELPHRRGTPLSFTFAHALVPSSLRESISSLRRQRLHRRAAQAIEAGNGRGDHDQNLEALAYHYEQAGDAELAQNYYLRAGQRALSVFANQEAERYFRAALELNRPSGENAAVLNCLGEAVFRQSRYPEAIQIWREAVALNREAGDWDRLAWLYARLARAAWYAGDAPGGLALCREGMDILKTADAGGEPVQSEGRTALLHETARALRFNDLNDEALPLCRQALEMAQRLGLIEIQVEALATLGILPNQEPEAAEQALQQAVDLAESKGLLAGAARAHLNLGGRLQDMGKFYQALPHLQKARDLARRMGIADWEYSFLSSAAYTMLSLGDLTAAEAALSELREVLSRIPNPADQPSMQLMLEGILLEMRGDLEAAIVKMQSARQEALSRGDSHFLANSSATLGGALVEANRLEEAEKVLLEAIELGDKDIEHDKIFSRCYLCKLRLFQGRLEEAHQLIEEAQKFFGQKPEPVTKLLIIWMDAEMAAAEQRWQESWDQFSMLSDRIAEIGMRWHHALMLLSWADWWVKRGDQESLEQAKDLYQEALGIYEDMGSPGYILRAQQKLRDLSQMRI